MTVPPNGTGDLVRASLHRATLADRDVVVRDGVPVTSVARTLVDLGRSSSIASAVVVADAALHGGMVTASELDAVLIRCWNWPASGGRYGRSIWLMAEQSRRWNR